MSAAGLRVLVVDDDIVVPMLLAMGLDSVEVIEASRSSEALRIAREIRPDAVIVDRNLPDGDGLDLIRALRAQPEIADAPILLVTAGHDEALRSAVLRSGADEYLGKPVDPMLLETTIRELLAQPSEVLRSRRERRARALPLRAEPAVGAAGPGHGLARR